MGDNIYSVHLGRLTEQSIKKAEPFLTLPPLPISYRVVTNFVIPTLSSLVYWQWLIDVQLSDFHQT